MPPADSTSRISSVAYATEESASLANTGRAIRFGSSVWPSLSLCMGRPTSTRLTTPNTMATSAC